MPKLRNIHKETAPEMYMAVPLTLGLKIILNICKVKHNNDEPEQLSKKELLPGSCKTDNLERSPRQLLKFSLGGMERFC